MSFQIVNYSSAADCKPLNRIYACEEARLSVKSRESLISVRTDIVVLKLSCCNSEFPLKRVYPAESIGCSSRNIKLLCFT